jgi:hypothetical protein
MCQEGIHLKDELEACFIELPSVLPKNTNSFPVYSSMQKYKKYL